MDSKSINARADKAYIKDRQKHGVPLTYMTAKERNTISYLWLVVKIAVKDFMRLWREGLKP